MSGIGSHTNAVRGQTDDWITPKHIIDALGPFDLDPCACTPQPWPCADECWTDNGLCREWFGRVWMNPPYGKQTGAWLDRLSGHKQGTALIFARTETDMFWRYVWERATAVFFIRGRLHFHHPDGRRAKGNAGGPSCLVAYGSQDASMLWRQKEIPGVYLPLVRKMS